MLEKQLKGGSIMDKLSQAMELMVKTGLFFANADGRYDSREKSFVDDFVANIEEYEQLDSSFKTNLEDALKHTYTLEEIIKETQTLVQSEFDETEKNVILESIKSFIQQVITIDGEENPRETQNFETWKQQLGVA